MGQLFGSFTKWCLLNILIIICIYPLRISYIISIIYTPPTHSFNAFQIFPLCFFLTPSCPPFFDPLSPICAAHIHKGVDLSTGAWATYWGHTHPKIDPPSPVNRFKPCTDLVTIFFLRIASPVTKQVPQMTLAHEFSDSFIFMPETGGPVFAYKALILNQHHWKEWVSWIPAPHRLGLITHSLPGMFLWLFHHFQVFSYLITLTEPLELELNDFWCLFVSLYITQSKIKSGLHYPSPHRNKRPSNSLFLSELSGDSSQDGWVCPLSPRNMTTSFSQFPKMNHSDFPWVFCCGNSFSQ